jgi:hypothetical protein
MGIGRVVVLQVPEKVVERTIFHHHDDDVLDPVSLESSPGDGTVDRVGHEPLSVTRLPQRLRRERLGIVGLSLG